VPPLATSSADASSTTAARERGRNLEGGKGTIDIEPSLSFISTDRLNQTAVVRRARINPVQAPYTRAREVQRWNGIPRDASRASPPVENQCPDTSSFHCWR